MALDSGQLASDLQAVFEDISEKTVADKAADLWSAIQSYIEGAAVASPITPGAAASAGTLTFPGMVAAETAFTLAMPGSVSTDPFAPPPDPALSFIGVAVLTAMTGIVVPPTSINPVLVVPGGVSATLIAPTPPVAPFLYVPLAADSEPTAADAAQALADAIHTQASSATFIVTIAMPPPAVPIPTPCTIL